MVKVMIILSILLLTMSTAGCANRAQLGAIGGAGTGAIVGQAIGHDTESTLIGTAVGTMFGYIFGNEVDKTGPNNQNRRCRRY